MSRSKNSKKILSVRYKIEKTYCLSVGEGRLKTTNAYLVSIADAGERLVGLSMLDLRGDRSDLAGKEVVITVELEE